MRNPIIEEDLENIIQAELPWHLLEGQRVLISGANGFLPAYMVETLLYLNEKRFARNRNVQVLGLVRNRDKALKRFSHYRERNDLELLVHDMSSPVFPIIEGDVSYVIHAASQASPRYYGTDPVGTLLPNVVGTYNLLELSRKRNIRSFLFFSSGEVYGEVRAGNIPTKESDYGYLDPTNIRSCYAESKRMGETMCVSWFQQFNVPAKIVRPFHTYGPGMDLQDGRVFADFVRDIVQSRNIHMKSDGSAVRAFCYLSDAIRGFFSVLLKGNNGEAYNVGNEQGEISIAALAELLTTLYPEKGLVVVRDNVNEPQGYLQSKISRNSPDSAKIGALGWKPVVSLREGFDRTIRSFTC